MRQLHRTTLLTGAALLAALAAAAYAQETRRDADNQQDRQRPGQSAREGQRPGQTPGQAIDRDNQQSARQRPGAAAQGGNVDDHVLATWLIIDNQGEVALAEFAQQRAQTPQVREFAQRMARDHQQFIQQLQEAAGRPGSNQPAAGQRRQARTETPGQDTQAGEEREQDASPPQIADTQADEARADRERTTGFRPGEGAGSRASSVIELKQQLGQQHTASLREELGKYQGADFDKAFMHSIVMGHLKEIDTLQVFSRNASPQLRETLAEGLQSTQEHLQMARQIVQQLSRGEGRQAQSRPDQSRQEVDRPNQRQPNKREPNQREPNQREPNEREPNEREPNERQPNEREGATEQP
ncbi:MAG TPA: DUF4142 domain-containing protein [Planctomycetaceae bacterium]|nr:DUF4142 domain-containing protein [Planctomycetaceae bacterium]